MSVWEFSHLTLRPQNDIRKDLKAPRLTLYTPACEHCSHGIWAHKRINATLSTIKCTGRIYPYKRCGCMEFVPILSKRSVKKNDLIEAARVRFAYTTLQELKKVSDKYMTLYPSTHSGWCNLCSRKILPDEYEEHIKEHKLMKAELIKQDFDEHVRYLELGFENEIHQDTSINFKNNQTCHLFRCLMCFHYILQDEEIVEHGDGYAHSICVRSFMYEADSKRNGIRRYRNRQRNYVPRIRRRESNDPLVYFPD